MICPILILLSQFTEEKLGILHLNGNKIEVLLMVPAQGKEARKLLGKKNKNPSWILFHNHKNPDFPSYHDVLVMMECNFWLQVITTPKGYYVIEMKKKISSTQYSDIIFQYQNLYPTKDNQNETDWIKKWNHSLNKKGIWFYFVRF